MQKAERMPDEITDFRLREWKVDEVADRALRMAVQNWTSGTAKIFVQNNRSAQPNWCGLEHWRNIISQFDPINTRVALEERGEIMRGGSSKTWSEFESKMIQDIYFKCLLEFTD